MNERRMSELIEQVRGVSYKPTDLHDSLDDDSVVLLRANNIDAGKINFDDVVYVDRAKVAPNQYLRRGDILVCASSGSRNLVGKAASVDFDKECTFGAFCKVVRPTNIDADYLGMYFQSNGYRSRIAELAQGININNIRNEHIDNLSVAVYDDKQQKRIVEILQKTMFLINVRRQQLQKLDDLIKTRFVEMFGDSIEKSKYPIIKLKDLSIKITDGVHAKPEYQLSGIPFLSVVNIVKGVIDFTDCKFVSKEAYERMILSTNPQKGDVLYTKVGATYGVPAYVDTDRKFCLYVSVCLIKPNHEKINSKFLSFAMKMPYIKQQADARIRGIGVPDLHLNQIREFDIIVPPLAIQNGFVNFVEQLDKSKVATQQSLAATRTLFDSLMQKYFG